MRIIIIGGGISGVSAAWYARKKYPDAKITLFEKTNRLGGVIESINHSGIFFEKGPRTFAVARSPNLLSFIHEVGLSDQLIFSKPLKRYLCINRKLKTISSFLPKIAFPLLREIFCKRGSGEDESIYDFSMRRFGPMITNTLIDAIAIGIYGANIRELSINACFPFMSNWEKKWGSVVLGALFHRRKNKGGLFTLRNGMESLIQEAAKKAGVEIFLNTPIESLDQSADLIISAIDGAAIGNLSGQWKDFEETKLEITHFAYKEDVLPQKGFGYLVPSSEKSSLLGVVFDSCIFPQQGTLSRLTAISQKPNPDLDVKGEPIFQMSHSATIPHFPVGYAKRLGAFQSEMKKKHPNLILLGNYIQGPSVDSCIELSQKRVMGVF